MADPYWRYADGRQSAVAPPPTHSMMPLPPQASLPMKRSRSDYPDMAGGPEMSGYYHRDEQSGPPRVIRESDSIGASYDRYLRSGQISVGGETGRPVTGGRGAPVDDPRMMGVGSMDGRNMGFGGGRSEMSLPPDASNTLFVEGLPSNCTRREVSHIFRPFVGFREVRLVSKESRHSGGEPLILCFVDFGTPGQATVALDALQGYKFDEHDRDSASLRLQYARFPGPRSAGGPRGRR
ncbi:U1 small nuclear ribonucleoprotein A [Acorus calamus]|uniref:U1 small nuclear ribonucleoprotein A n=1 Tax=Acorus calamus TaxID=4465 RepID=A0AAV9DWD1_ACOCL|nr:U1 small nuclear ribonucleoprotein A [Acorus calamus]